jgi:DNA polymerase III gamma/tau subunit
MELYKKYRPKKLWQIVGQTESVKTLANFLKRKNLPHSLLLSGPSGCGKTTIARILKKELKCSGNDFNELNMADLRGIDEIRAIRNRIYQTPMSGECRIWLIDEAHKLTNDAQNAFLKMLEDTPRHVYFFLATTEPHKLIKTIRTRCTEIQVSELSEKELKIVVSRVVGDEKKTIDDSIIEKIVEKSEGSARKALVILEKVLTLDNEKDQNSLLDKITLDQEVKNLARVLINPRVTWQETSSILKTLTENEAETIRRGVLGYSKAVLLSGGKLANRAYLIIDCFRDPLYDSGFPGLVAYCYEVVLGSK